MKTLILAALAATTLATASFAGGVTNSTPGDNYVHRDMIWDQDAQKTRPTLIVAMDGDVTRYEIGQLGLTRDIIVGDYSLKAQAWAKSTLGRDLTAVMFHDSHGRD